jgi:uncharacterized protein YabN with tetrapyrrole methylase and pyrophosphatase domain
VALADNGSDDAEARVGELLFAAVATARKLGVDAESALRRATRDFAERFEGLMSEVEDDGDPSLSEDAVRRLFGRTS